jgi:hypothetical protein
LLGTMARTAVISGTATAVSNRVSGGMHQAAHQQVAAQQRQMQAAAAQQALAQQQAAQAAAAPAPAARADERIARLQKLGGLQKSGILTAEEFASEKAKILAS